MGTKLVSISMELILQNCLLLVMQFCLKTDVSKRFCDFAVSVQFCFLFFHVTCRLLEVAILAALRRSPLGGDKASEYMYTCLLV